MKLIAVTSPATDAGKTFIAAGIAEAATYHNLKTLFMDFDNPVGDALRVFGVSSHNLYPTLGDWASYPDPWGGCLKSKAGTYLLPRPNMLDEEIDAEGLLKSVEDFDLVIADLGTDYRQEYWRSVVNQADLALLVSDCDEKALVRVRQFLNSKPANKEWTLIINSRERKGYYTESQIERELSGEVQQIISLPYFPEAEQRSPKTFPPESVHLVRVLNLLFSEVSVEENLFNKIKIPRLNFKRKAEQEESLKPAKPKASFSTKTGVIVGNEFIKIKFDNPNEIDFEYDALVITASMGLSCVKDYRRQNPLRPVVVLNGDKSFLEIGADKCVKRINRQVIDEMTHLNDRIRKLWMQMETDSLTGAYTRAFFEKWREDRESRGKGYTAVMIDIDKFKVVNDTYGHDAGDLVLHQFAQFLKNSVRDQDLVVRWGGEEFIVALPDTNVKQGYVVMDRLREIWAGRAMSMPNGEIYKSTFSAGVAQYKGQGHDVIKEADELMYIAKNSGRNKVLPVTASPKITILGSIPTAQFIDRDYQILTDPREADCIIADINTALSLPSDIIPPGINLYILGKGKPSDLKVKQAFPDASLYKDVKSIISAIEGNPIKVDIQGTEKPVELPQATKPNITVLPGVRSNKNNLTLPKGGVVFVVCPSRPGIASELSAKLASIIGNTALVCAAPESSAALNLGIDTMTLVEADWRFPRSFAPIHYSGIYVWPVDPHKHTGSVSSYDIHRLVEQIKHKFNLVIVDCCGSLSYCSRVAHDEAIMVIKKEGDSSDIVTEQWLTNYKGQNVIEVSPIETPSITEVDNGLLISTKALNYKEQFN